MDKAIIVGAGTYGQVYAEYLRDCGVEIAGYLDDDTKKLGQRYGGIKVLGTLDMMGEMPGLGIGKVFAPLGNNETRQHVLRSALALGLETPCFVHPEARIHHTVTHGVAFYALPGTNVMPLTSFGDFVMVSMGVNIAHHVDCENACFFSQGSNIGASIQIGEMAFVGIAATVMTGVKRIGRLSTIGAGAMVIRDVPDGAVVVGNPARVLEKKKKEI